MSELRPAALPLQGKRILVTRTSDQAAALSERLSALGAIPITFPVIRIIPPRDWAELDAALARLYPAAGACLYYSWLVFTSANAVRICCERMRVLGYEPRGMAGTRIAAIGPATAAALARYGLSADLVPGEYIAESIAASLIAESQQGGETLAGKRILLPRAAEARKVLAVALQQAGASVDEMPAYVTVSAAATDEQSGAVLAQLQTGQLDVITFTSSSTVRNFIRWLADCLSVSTTPGDDQRGAAAALLKTGASYSRKPAIACIGPITSQTARECGLDVHIEAGTFTIDGLVAAIVHYYHAIERASLLS